MKVEDCQIDGVSAYTVTLQGHDVRASIGLTIKGSPCGAFEMSGLGAVEPIQQAAAELIRVIEEEMVKRIGRKSESTQEVPRGLFDHNLSL